MPRGKLIALISSLTVLISGCASDYAALVSNPTPWGGEYSGDWLDFYRNQTINWKSCSSDFLAPPNQISPNFEKNEAHCAFLKVPVLYSEKKNPGDLEIAVIKDSADKPSQTIGTVFTNPGGPGGSGVDMIQWGMFPQSVQDVYDIVGFDPRGVARSSPIKCSSETALSELFNTYFDTQTDTEAAWNANFELTYFEDCKNSNPYWYAMGTENVVKDIDILRAAITPEKKLNFVGHSYGTVLAARYISKFPKNSGYIILDSPVRDKLGGSGWSAQDDSFAVARNLLFKRCAEDSNCPGSSVSAIEDNFIGARDAILAGEMSGFVAQQKGSSYFQKGVQGSPELLYSSIQSLAYLDIDRAYEMFLPAYKQMLSGEYTLFEKLGLEFQGFNLDTLVNDNSNDMLYLVNCLDVDQSNWGISNQNDSFTNQFYDPNPETVAITGLQGCFWSIEAVNDTKVIDPLSETLAYINKTKNPFLVIGTVYDNATPYDWAVSVAASLNSPLVTYEGTGHANLWSGIQCVDNPAIDYLLSGDLPTSDIDCPVESAPINGNFLRHLLSIEIFK